MRDEHASPTDRDTTDAATGRTHRQSGPDGGASSVPPAAPPSDRRADAPVVLLPTEHMADVEEATLSDEEIAMYRRRIAEGFYNSREVAAEVARRMLERRDI